MLLLSDKSITCFVARSKEDIGTVICLDKIMATSQEPHAGIFEMTFQVAKELAFLDIAVVGITVSPIDSFGLLSVGEWGEVRIFQGDSIIQETFEVLRGPMRQARKIGDQVFAVGAAAQVFRRDVAGHWIDFGPDPAKISDHRLAIFSDVDGFSSDDVYVAGTEGTIWHFDRGGWKPIQCGTNLSFHSIHCAEDGRVYACGQAGIVAAGRGVQFDLISPVDRPLADLWGVRLYQDRLFCASMRALLELGKNGLEPCLPAMDLGHTFYGLDQADGVLWSVGEKDVLRFDGSNWEAAEDPEWIV